MNKKTLATGFLTAVVACSLVFTTSVSAFWPFDALFGKGSVKAAITTKERQPAVIQEKQYVVGGVRKPAILIDTEKQQGENLSVALNGLAQMCSSHNSRATSIGKTVSKTTPASKELALIQNALQAECKRVDSLLARFNKVKQPNVGRPITEADKASPEIVNGTATQCTKDAECQTGKRCTENNTQNSRELRVGYCITVSEVTPAARLNIEPITPQMGGGIIKAVKGIIQER